MQAGPDVVYCIPKTKSFMKLRFFTPLVILLFPLFTQAQSQPEHHYVTIGVFRMHDHAIAYTDKANKQNFNAQYAIHAEKQLYYVYLLDTEDKKKAYNFLIKIRVETEYKTAWVYNGILGDQQETPAVVKAPVIEEPKKEEPVVETPKAAETLKEPITDQPIAKTDSSLIRKEPEKKPEGKPFYFKLLDKESGEETEGEIHIITAAAAPQYQSFPANQTVYIKKPASGLLQITTVSAGYREEVRTIDYVNPANSTAEVNSQQEAIVAFPLTKVKLGDYIEFTNVRFIPNTALLQPEAKNELDGLINLMKENKKYKIRIHAHCNGSDPRDIVSKGNSAQYFATDPANLRETVSAKRLTELRAELVKNYMVSEGIEAKRIGTKAEGGSTMIYPQNSTLSGRNDRIEVEVSRGR